MRATRDEDIARYFEKTEQGYRLVPRIRERVRFAHHSLSAPTYPRPASRAHGFDLVLCRNVLIYFIPRPPPPPRSGSPAASASTASC